MLWFYRIACLGLMLFSAFMWLAFDGAMMVVDELLAENIQLQMELNRSDGSNRHPFRFDNPDFTLDGLLSPEKACLEAEKELYNGDKELAADCEKILTRGGYIGI